MPIVAPTNVTAKEVIQNGVSFIEVQWTPVTGATSYLVKRLTDGVEDTTEAWISYTYIAFDSNPLDYHQYSYSVKAYLLISDEYSEASFSNIVTPTLYISDNYLPINLKSELTIDSTVKLTWDWVEPYLNIGQTYTIEFALDGYQGEPLVFTDLATVALSLTHANEYEHTNPLVGHLYHYRIRVNYLTWTSSRVYFPDVYVWESDPSIILIPPLSLAATFDDDGYVVLTWKDETKSRLRHVIMRAIFDVAGNKTTDWTVLAILEPGVNLFKDLTASPSVIQQYAICSKYQTNFSYNLYSDKLPGRPATPISLVATPGTSTIELTWEEGKLADITTVSNNAYRNNPVVNYQLDRRVAQGSWLTIATLVNSLLTTLAYSDSDVIVGQYYTYRISATNGAGSSLYSLQTSNVRILPTLFTIAEPMPYSMPNGLSKTIVIGKEGAGQLHSEVFGVASIFGYTWYTDLSGLGYMIDGITSFDLITGRFGSRLFGGKTLYSIELNTTCPDDIKVEAFSRQADGKFHRVDLAEYSPEYGRARLIASGPEFKLRFRMLTGNPKSFSIDKAVAWLKTTDKRGFNTVPQIIEQERQEDKNI
jgi:hypothetical protein